MQITGRTWGFAWFRDVWCWPRPWWRGSVRFGWGIPFHVEDTYRQMVGFDYCLLPNFIWYQDVIRQQVNHVEIQYRIVGIQDWPLLRLVNYRRP